MTLSISRHKLCRMHHPRIRVSKLSSNPSRATSEKSAIVPPAANSYRDCPVQTVENEPIDSIIPSFRQCVASCRHRAIEPQDDLTAGMATLIGMSTPCRKAGLLLSKVQGSLGRSDDDVLVIPAPTVLLNPTIDRALIDREREQDPQAARAESLAGSATTSRAT